MMTKIFKIIPRAIASLTMPVAAIRKIRQGSGIRILMYHRVTDDPSDRLCVTPREFIRQMDLLCEGNYRVTTISSAFSAQPPEDSRPVIVITFDDGYQDFYDIVYPILKERKIPAVVFVIPDFIEGRISLPRYQDSTGNSSSVSWDMLREISGSGITVGSHSLTHREMPALTEQEAEKEIKGSADIIEERLGIRPEWFSYPRGKYSPRHPDLVLEAGYRGAVTVQPGPNRRPYEYFALRRTEISRSDTLEDFKLKLSGGYDFQHSLWQKIRGKRL